MNTKTTAEALKRLDVLESELSKNATEAKQIRSILSEPKNIMEAVKTFDDALEIYKSTQHISKEIQTLLDYKGSDAEVIAMQGVAQINIIRAVLNQGWAPNWKNSSEYKYYPWFNMSGVGLSCNVYDSSGARTGVGSRLCFKSSELAKYAGTQFINIYEKFYVI